MKETMKTVLLWPNIPPHPIYAWFGIIFVVFIFTNVMLIREGPGAPGLLALAALTFFAIYSLVLNRWKIERDPSILERHPGLKRHFALFAFATLVLLVVAFVVFIARGGP